MLIFLECRGEHARYGGLRSRNIRPYDGRIVLWRTEIRGDKPTKVPYQVTGRARAKSNAPSTWGDFEAAREDDLGRGGFEGLGIMLGDLGDGRFLVGLDLDLCRSPLTGEIMPWARNWVDRWPSYIEVSPSGTGLKGYRAVYRHPRRRRQGNHPRRADPGGCGGDQPHHAGDRALPLRPLLRLNRQAPQGTWLELCDVTEAFDSARLEMDKVGR